MRHLSPAVRSLLLGTGLALAGAMVLVLFADRFRVGATWSPMSPRGGPGVLFILGPALAGWFWVAGWVKRPTAIIEAVVLGALAAVPVGLVAVVLDSAWATAPHVLESLFSTIAVALVVSAVASTAVRLVPEPAQPQE